MFFLTLALKSIRNRLSTALLTLLSIALSVSLILSVERTQRAAEEGFTQSVSQVDLLVGALTGPLNLILFTIFNMGSIANNISWKTYQNIKSRPEVAWTIPYSLGDGHRGFRVVATDENFYEHYRFRGQQKVEFFQGQAALGLWDVVIGSDVYNKLKYQMGDKVIIDHGVTHSEGFQHHDDKPFHVTGILKPTGTAIDKSLYISLEGMEAIHLEGHDGAISKIEIEDITSFFLRTKNRIETLQLQRDLNNYTGEPLSAVIPGVALAELWKGLSQIEIVLKLISYMVLIIGMAAMSSSILAGLNERRREMAILRSLGASSSKMMLLMLFESSLLTLGGIMLGLMLEVSSFSLLSQWIEGQFGFSVSGSIFTEGDFVMLLMIWLFGTMVGLLPALRASYLSLKDGLTIKV